MQKAFVARECADRFLRKILGVSSVYKQKIWYIRERDAQLNDGNQRDKERKEGRKKGGGDSG